MKVAMGVESFAIKNNSTEEHHSAEVLKAFDEVSIIAQIVGGDFGMKVAIGKKGRGSFFNPQEVSVTIDPDHLTKNLNKTKFIVAHEGGHRAITRSAVDLGVPRETVHELYSKPGFGFIQNAIEDPADNDWFSQKFAGLKSYVKENYDGQFNSEDVVLSTPEVMDYAKQLGFMPKFAKFGSEVIRHWHQGRYSNKLDSEVLEALQKTENFVKTSIATIPSSALNEDDVVEKAQKRFQINTEEVWPHVEKLAEEDLQDAKRNEVLEDIKKQMQQKSADNSGKKESKSNKSKKTKEQNPQENSSDKDGVSENGVPETEANSLEKQLKDSGFSDEDIKGLKEMMESQKPEKGQRSKQSSGGRGSGEDMDSGDRKEKDNDIKGEGKEKNLEKNEDLLEELGEKLDKYLNSLPEDKKQKIEEKAQEKLENFEDALNKSLESKLNPEKVQNHQEVRRKNEEHQKKERQEKKQEENKKVQEKKLEEMRKSMMTPYEKYRSEVSGQIDNLYYRLKKVLKPEDFGKEDSGFSSGQTLDMVRVMQSDYDFNQKTKLWIREDQPEFRDYRFMNLIDMSSSMRGKPIQEVFKGFVVVGEALDRLEDFNSEKIKVHQSIKGFHDKVFDYKDFNKRFSEDLEKKLATIVENTDGGTDTYKGTIKALEDVNKNLGKTGNFLLTFTDGSPNYDSAEKLKNLLKNNREERRKKRIRVGLVWLNDATDQELKKMINEYGYDFGLVLETQQKKWGKDFAEKLGDVVEDIIENPQKY